MAVKDTLPEELGTSRADHFGLALTALRNALLTRQIGEAGDAGATNAMVIHTQIALAEVRAWRKSLPDQGVRQDDYLDHRPDRELLLAATHGVLLADAGTIWSLRNTEAALRTLIKRHQAGA